MQLMKRLRTPDLLHLKCLKAILRGILSKKDFREAQRDDEFCSSILNSPQKKKNFVLIDDLLYSKRGDYVYQFHF